MNVDFETAAIPAVTVNRTAEPNPFDGKFPSDEAALVVTIDGTEEEQAAQVKKIISQARKAAQAVDRTARKKTEAVEVGTGKTKHNATRVYLWTVSRVTRPRQANADGNTAE